MLLVGSTSTTNANPVSIENPRFYNDSSDNALARVINTSFGWFKTLDDEQKQAYYSTIVLALEEAQPGQFVRWYKNNASGFVRVAWQYPHNGSVCKRLHMETIAYGVVKPVQVTACYNEIDDRWAWNN